MERSYKSRHYERLVMISIGNILLLVMMLIVAISEQLGASLIGRGGGSTSYLRELYGKGPQWP